MKKPDIKFFVFGIAIIVIIIIGLAVSDAQSGFLNENEIKEVNHLLPPLLNQNELTESKVTKISFEEACIMGLPGQDCSAYPKHEFIGKNMSYTRSEGSIYYRGKLVVGADNDSFDALWGSIGKDKDSLFFKTDRIVDSKPELFKTFGKYSQYATDGQKVYTGTGVMEGVDGASFEVINENYIRDFDTVFYNQERLLGVDAPTFEILEAWFTRDINYLYYRNKKIEGSDSDSFEFINTSQAKSYTYAKDDNFIYKNGKVLEGVDSGTFEFIKNGYARDKQYVFRPDGTIVEEADPKSFVFLEGSGFSYCMIKKDINYLFGCGDQIIVGADLESFHTLRPFYLDKNHVYGPNGNIFEADRLTFSLLGNGYAKDVNNLWFVAGYEGNFFVGEVEDVDVDTFEVIGNVYGSAKDKNATYYIEERGKLIRELIVNN